MADNNDNSKDFYKNAYSGKATNSWTGNPDRLAVVHQYASMLWSNGMHVRCLDIGCGAGLHTAFIGEEAHGHWTGVDMCDADTMKLAIPRNGRFAVVDLRTDDGWQHLFLQEKYNLIVDQGAVFVSLDNDDERNAFVAHVTSALDVGGYFIGLVVKGAWGRMVFPDGRVRFRMTEADVEKQCDLLWRSGLGLESVEYITHRYEPGPPYNPLTEPIEIMHVVFKKIR